MKKLALLFPPLLFLCGCSGHTLAVSTVPKEAAVVLIPLNGAPAPYSYGKRYPLGEYTLKISNPGYIAEDRTVILDKDTRIEVVLKRASHTLRISAVPSDALIALTSFGGGERIKYQGGAIPEGEYLLTVSREGYQTYEAVLVLNKDIAETVTLKKSPSAINFARVDTPVKEVKKEEGVKNLGELFTAEYLRVGLSPLAKGYLAQAVKEQDLKVLFTILEQIKTDIDMKYTIAVLEGGNGNASETALAFIYLTGYLADKDTDTGSARLEKAVTAGGKAALCLKIYALLEKNLEGEAETLAKTSSLTKALPALKNMRAKETSAKDILRYVADL